MAVWQDAFSDWALAWASVQDQASEIVESVVRIGSQHLMVWPGDPDAAAGATSLLLVTDDPDGASQFAQSLGLQAQGRQVLLSAVTEELDLVPELPADANLAEAPMENYDLVEVALFDRPVARGRLSLGEEIAVLAALSVDAGNDELLGMLEQAMVSALGEEAFTHGADTLFLIADEEQAARFVEVDGWKRAAEILSFGA
ncbi:hypothetical protein CVS30_06555 [Arthrobacter psychrolactophilus]|uniref:Uncharacterized protein n=1 Tax=Arthrobacter psychrolactophilus TaxID=92442 RepID=A0A2V5ISK2_9MICC|nr:hypothetical protein [Arthrobacter psychrolactophilus]PYI38971.1 hypothetical protein CVS30_06555 [Arthrobacter psychrolactophilus]